jgi:DNA repair protein RecO (recombination protein O)
MPKIIKTQGFVLNTAPFKESSLFATILTKKHGKIKILAKGVRRPTSKFCGTMELFNHDEIIFYRKENREIHTLSDAVVIDGFDNIRADPVKVNAGMVLCEFYYKTLPPEERADASFILLLDFLKELQRVTTAKSKSLTYYYLLKALSGAGVRPHLDNCVRCHAEIPQDNNKIDFSIGAGGVVCNKDFDDTVVILNNNTFEILKNI